MTEGVRMDSMRKDVGVGGHVGGRTCRSASGWVCVHVSAGGHACQCE